MNVLWVGSAAFAAGVATSAGPCVAPRVLAGAALCAGTSGTARRLRLVAFAAGVCATSAAAWLGGAALRSATGGSWLLYAAVAIASLLAGIATLAGKERCEHDERRSLAGGAAFLAGAGVTLVSSPCCGPLSGIVGAGAGFSGAGPAVALGFAIGHALPIALLGAGCARFERRSCTWWPPQATRTLAGALSLALGAYYGLLA